MSGPWFGPGARDREPQPRADPPLPRARRTAHAEGGWLTRPRAVAHTSRADMPRARDLRADVAPLPHAQEPRTRAGGPLRRARRFLFRTRYPLAPLWCALAVALVTVLLRDTLPRVLAVCAVLVLWFAAGLRPAPESRALSTRRALATVGHACAAWAVWVICWAPDTGTASGMLAVGTLAAWPWWWRNHRARASRAAGRFARAWPYAVAQLRLAGVALLTTEPGEVEGQWSHRVDLAGHRIDKLISALPDLEAKLGLRRGALRVEPVHADASRAVLHVVAVDPLTPPEVDAQGQDDGIPMPDPDPDLLPVDPWPVGPYEDGPLIELHLGQHILVIAGTGGGKGVFASNLIAQAVARRCVVVWAIDFKGGRLVARWGRCIRRAVTNAEGLDAGILAARQQLADALDEVDRRAAAGAHTGLDGHQVTDDDPHILYVMDEVERLLDDPVCLDLVLQLTDVARSECITLVMMVKKVTRDVIRNTRLLTNIRTRVLLGIQDNPADIRRAIPNLADFPLESLDRPGKALIYLDGQTRPRPGRIWNPTPDQIAALRAQYEPPETATTPDTTTGTQEKSERSVGASRAHEGAQGPAGPVPVAADAPAMPTGVPSTDLARRLLAWAAGAGMSRSELMRAGGWSATSTMYEHLAPLRGDEVEGRAAQVVNVRRRWYLVEHAPADVTVGSQNPVTGE
ncbi:hypothetical protein [Parafrankia sp. EUN1f]|uniref:hypothetical protein n=1 Tax=Parafrankia sp. EUN1f TaxID=102897 RepID=UPI0001C46CF4|nr:hypothetical protein [Parafrankia sp. EUN1f]EFC80163.1 hypothetical protein FrEUN1fDRAFT_6692 [Parafrankia sp. EUN1f]